MTQTSEGQSLHSSMDSIASRNPDRHQQQQTSASLLPSPTNWSSNTRSCSGNSNVYGAQPRCQQQPPSPPPPPTLAYMSPTPPLPSQSAQPPKPITRSEPGNPYATTFVQADTSSFKQFVQILTGSSETVKQATANPTAEQSSRTHIPPIKSIPRRQQSGFKLYERRNSLKNLKVNPLIPSFALNNSGFSTRKPEILSPSILDFPSLVLSPVTPLIPDPFDLSAAPSYRCNPDGNGISPSLNTEAEEKAIKEKGFFLHPSPTTTPRDSQPRLLPLFPTSSPRASGSSSS